MNKDFSFSQSNLSMIQIITVPVVRDYRGNLAFLQWNDLPFEFKRVYYLFDIPSGAKRGGHAHREQTELLIALSGSFDVILDDAVSKKKIHLNNPEKALLIPPGIWREIENFSANSICLVLNSDLFTEEDYIRNYEDFIRLKTHSK